ADPAGPRTVGAGPGAGAQHHLQPVRCCRAVLRRVRRSQQLCRRRAMDGVVQLFGRAGLGPLSGTRIAMKLVVVAVLCGIGLFFSLSAAVGILRMPDIYTRLQCSSKSITMGALPLLLALVVAKGAITAYAGRALMVGLL